MAVELVFVAYLVFTMVTELQQVIEIGLGAYCEEYYNVLDLMAIMLMFVAMLCWLQIELIAPNVQVPDKFVSAHAPPPILTTGVPLTDSLWLHCRTSLSTAQPMAALMASTACPSCSLCEHTNEFPPQCFLP